MRAGGINIVTIHQHMTHDQPHYFFMHYWGKGNAQELAKTIQKALDAQANGLQLVIPRSLAAGTPQAKMKGWKKGGLSGRVAIAHGKYTIT